MSIARRRAARAQGRRARLDRNRQQPWVSASITDLARAAAGRLTIGVGMGR